MGGEDLGVAIAEAGRDAAGEADAELLHVQEGGHVLQEPHEASSVRRVAVSDVDEVDRLLPEGAASSLDRIPGCRSNEAMSRLRLRCSV